MAHLSGNPLVTFALISFRDEKYIGEAVEGAFSQTYRPLEIILSNDCSPDRTFEIMKRMAAEYRGPHKIVLNRTEKNLGTGGHINRIMQISRGELIVIAAGDDVSLPERTSRLAEAYWSSRGRAKSLNSGSMVIDGEGRTKYIFRDHGAEERYRLEAMGSSRYILTGSTHAWSRDVFDIFGPLLTPLNCEDMVIPFRSALLGEIRYLDEPLVKYRRHGKNSWPDADFLTLEKIFTFQDVAICKNWLRDLDTYVRLRPDEQSRLAGLRMRIRERLEAAEEKAFLYNSSWMGRVAFLLSKPVRRATLKRQIRNAAFFLAPPAYKTYLYVRNKIRKNRIEKTRAVKH